MSLWHPSATPTKGAASPNPALLTRTSMVLRGHRANRVSRRLSGLPERPRFDRAFRGAIGRELEHLPLDTAGYSGWATPSRQQPRTRRGPRARLPARHSIRCNHSSAWHPPPRWEGTPRAMRTPRFYGATPWLVGKDSRRFAATSRGDPAIAATGGGSDLLTQGRGEAVEPPVQRQECGKAVAIRFLRRRRLGCVDGSLERCHPALERRGLA
jgi:hypothetical protein